MGKKSKSDTGLGSIISIIFILIVFVGFGVLIAYLYGYIPNTEKYILRKAKEHFKTIHCRDYENWESYLISVGYLSNKDNKEKTINDAKDKYKKNYGKNKKIIEFMAKKFDKCYTFYTNKTIDFINKSTTEEILLLQKLNKNKNNKEYIVSDDERKLIIKMSKHYEVYNKDDTIMQNFNNIQKYSYIFDSDRINNDKKFQEKITQAIWKNRDIVQIDVKNNKTVAQVQNTVKVDASNAKNGNNLNKDQASNAAPVNMSFNTTTVSGNTTSISGNTTTVSGNTTVVRGNTTSVGDTIITQQGNTITSIEGDNIVTTINEGNTTTTTDTSEVYNLVTNNIYYTIVDASTTNQVTEDEKLSQGITGASTNEVSNAKTDDKKDDKEDDKDDEIIDEED